MVLTMTNREKLTQLGERLRVLPSPHNPENVGTILVALVEVFLSVIGVLLGSRCEPPRDEDSVGQELAELLTLADGMTPDERQVLLGAARTMSKKSVAQ